MAKKKPPWIRRWKNRWNRWKKERLDQRKERLERNQKRALKLEDATTAAEIRTATIGYLRTHRNWYKSSGWRYTHSWHALTFLVIVLGALTSILTAMERDFHIWREVLIILPALSSLFAAILVQFRLREGCRIRDSGRIAADELIGEAHGIDVKNRNLAMREALRLRAAAHRIEKEQLSQFMAETPSGNGADRKH